MLKFFAIFVVSVFTVTSVLADDKKPSALDNLNVLLVVVDTLGTEHLGLFNPKLTDTPNLNRLAKNGVLFKRAYSAAPWTKPSIASIMTSLFPSEHKVNGLNSLFRPELQTMAELFKAEGRPTAGFISHTLIDAKTGYNQGFDEYKIVKFKGNVHDSTTSHQVTDLALDWLKRQGYPASTSDKKPFFMFLHYFDPHFNYQHHAEFDQTSGYKGPLTAGMGLRALRRAIPTMTKSDIDFLVGLYHEEIAYTDKHIGRLLDNLAASGLSKNTIVILTADHGEEFMRHGKIGHTATLFDELVHVPLIFSLPGVFGPKVVEESVTTIDILPTLFSIQSDSAVKPEWRGISLKPYLTGQGAPPKDRYFYSEVDFRSSGIKAYKVGVSHQSFKLVYDKPTKVYELYDRAKDPEELHDIAQQNPKMVAELTKKIEEFRSKFQPEGAAPSEEIERSPEEIQQLKSLGYL